MKVFGILGKISGLYVAGVESENSNKLAEVYLEEDFFGGKFFALDLIRQR